MSDKKNVIDFYAYWTTEAIKADLDTKRNPFSVLISNKFNDFNIGSVIRNANAFLANEVIIYGQKKWDRRASVGTHNYMDFKHIREEDDLDQIKIPIIGVDNLEGAVPLDSFEWPREPFVMAFGQEQVGLPPEILARCRNLVYIQQLGSVRSLNVGCASGIAMYDFCQKSVYTK